MKLHRTESGLIVPAEKPQPPKRPHRQYGLLEIQDEKNRAVANGALLLLWDAMELSRGGFGINLPGDTASQARAVHDLAYHALGEMLLGDDCPEKEVNT